MAENTNKISQVQVGDTTYDICDAAARSYIAALNISDSWHNLTLADTTLGYADNQTPMYRRYGDVVNVVGAVKPKTEVPAGIKNTLTIATLPAEYCPKNIVATLCQGSGAAFWLLRITPAGVMTAERYRIGSEYAAIGTDVWLAFNATFISA